MCSEEMLLNPHLYPLRDPELCSEEMLRCPRLNPLRDPRLGFVRLGAPPPDPRKTLILARLRLARIRQHFLPCGFTIIRTNLLNFVTVSIQ
jgi:hypothetical protein